MDEIGDSIVGAIMMGVVIMLISFAGSLVGEGCTEKRLYTKCLELHSTKSCWYLKESSK